nr:MAG TPA: hypothetical protein [Caudoviricetes sp.]
MDISYQSLNSRRVVSGRERSEDRKRPCLLLQL